jgi:hypothetical protein
LPQGSGMLRPTVAAIPGGRLLVWINGPLLEVGDIGGSDDGADAGAVMSRRQFASSRTLRSRSRSELGGTVADGAPSFQKR